MSSNNRQNDSFIGEKGSVLLSRHPIEKFFIGFDKAYLLDCNDVCSEFIDDLSTRFRLAVIPGLSLIIDS